MYCRVHITATEGGLKRMPKKRKRIQIIKGYSLNEIKSQAYTLYREVIHRDNKYLDRYKEIYNNSL